MNTEKLHARPPLLTPEIYQAVAKYAEGQTEEKPEEEKRVRVISLQ